MPIPPPTIASALASHSLTHTHTQRKRVAQHLLVVRFGNALVLLRTRPQQALHLVDLLMQLVRIDMKKVDVDNEDDGPPSSDGLRLATRANDEQTSVALRVAPPMDEI